VLRLLTLLLPTLWLGVLVGVSGIATPVKFRAPSLSLPAALDVGRVTFRLFSRVEWVFAILLLGLYGAVERAVWPLALGGLAAGLVVVQSAWLLPALDRRAGAVLAGGTATPSRAHRIYVAAEGCKLLALLALIAVGLADAGRIAP
jgi:hypothetical protein